MNFAPFHNFPECALLEAKVQQLHAAGSVPEAIYIDHLRYHFSLLHKLKSAKYHVESLEKFLNSQQTATADPGALLYRINFHFDGFVYVLGSALDMLAREVLSYYGLVPAGNVYFGTAYQQINTARPGDPVLPLLEPPSWKQEFSEYRNTATHETVVTSGYALHTTMVGHTPTHKFVCPLPDDPRAITQTYGRNPNIVEYCKTTLTRSLRLVNPLYRHLRMQANATGALPI